MRKLLTKSILVASLGTLAGMSVACATSKIDERFDGAIYLPFDKGIVDVGPYHYKTRAYGDQVRIVRGYRGQGVFFGGTAGWIEVYIDERLSLDRGATIESCVRPEAWPNPYIRGSNPRLWSA